MNDQFSLEDRNSFELKEVWKQVLKNLREEVSETVYDRFLKPLEPLRYNDGQVTLLCPRPFVYEWVQEKFLNRLEQILSLQLNESIRVYLEKASTPEDSLQPELSFSSLSVHIAKEVDPIYNYERFQPHDRYRFETFIVGQSNRLAFAGAKAVSSELGTKYNPLFIYGASGLGKTHLMHSIAQSILSQDPNYPITYISAQQFAEKFVHSLQNNKIEHFRKAQRGVGVWLVDDIQFIAGKDKTQEEIFHTFNHMHSMAKQIVLCSDRPPRDLILMDERLRSRFESGLVADIQPPDNETRCAILLSKAKQEKIILSHDAATYLAENVPGNVRILEGALIKIAAEASIDHAPITMELVLSIVNRYYKPNFLVKPNTEQIIDTVSEFYYIPVSDIKGESRKAPIAHARHVAVYLIREITRDSWKHIGSVFGNRDHTSMMHAHQKITDMMGYDKELQKGIENLMQRFCPEV